MLFFFRSGLLPLSCSLPHFILVAHEPQPIHQAGRAKARPLCQTLALKVTVMISLLRLVGKLPIPTELQLSWQRTLLSKKLKDKERVESLERDHRFEINLHDEEEDAYLTKTLLSKARKLRVPVPHRYNEDKTESEHWYEGNYTGRWYLTTRGFAALREEIRHEVKARHESRAQWVIWPSTLTGVIGAATGLIALLLHKSS